MEQNETREERYIFDITKVKVVDLDGNVFQSLPLGASIGNACFQYFTTIEWDGLARSIHKNEAVDLNKAELEQLTQLIRSPQMRISAMVRSSLTSYINTLKPENNGSTAENRKLEKSSL